MAKFAIVWASSLAMVCTEATMQLIWTPFDKLRRQSPKILLHSAVRGFLGVYPMGLIRTLCAEIHAPRNSRLVLTTTANTHRRKHS
jgi:hypothetical protein